MRTMPTNVLGLLSRIGKLEEEFNALVAAATDQQQQLDVNSTRQQDIAEEQAGLQAQSQQLITDHQANTAALVHSQNAYDFSLPVWNVVLMSWEQIKELISRLPDPPAETAAGTSQPADQPSN